MFKSKAKQHIKDILIVSCQNTFIKPSSNSVRGEIQDNNTVRIENVGVHGKSSRLSRGAALPAQEYGI